MTRAFFTIFKPHRWLSFETLTIFALDNTLSSLYEKNVKLNERLDNRNDFWNKWALLAFQT